MSSPEGPGPAILSKAGRYGNYFKVGAAGQGPGLAKGVEPLTGLEPVTC
jgi:hypothetical protein